MSDTNTDLAGKAEVVRVRLQALDADTSPEFKEQLAEVVARGRHVVLDLRDVEFIDSSGLGAILGCLRELNAAQADLKLCGVSQTVRTMLELVRMHRLLEIHPTAEDALASF